MLLHILSLNPAAPAYQDEALKRAQISRQDRPAHSSSDYLSFSLQKNKKMLQIVDKVAYNYINDKLLDSLWGEVQFTKKECKSTIDWTPGQAYLGPNWKSLILFKETNKYDADGAGWDNAVAGLQIMISCPKGWGTHTPKCFLNHHHHRQHFTQPPSPPPSPPPLPKCPPPLTEM